MPRIDLRGPREYFSIKLPRLIVGLSTFSVMVGVYFASILIPPGKITYALTVPALTIIMFTTIVSLNDMDRDMCSARWNTRLFARLFVAAFALAQFLAPFANLYRHEVEWPTWRIVCVAWGLALYYLSSQRNSWFNFAFGDQPHQDEQPRRRSEDFDGIP